MKAGDTTNLNFELINTGNDILKIININGSCECASFKYDTTAIPPNNSITVSLVYTHNPHTKEALKNIVFQTNGTPQFGVIYLKETSSN